jgi:hypothetical protein
MKRIHLIPCALAVCLGFVACEEYPGAYIPLEGFLPEVLYVRLTDPAKADSMLTEADMGATVCLVGNNLRAVRELYFNDRKAELNTSFITDHTLVVAIPGSLPQKVDNKMYMITASGATVTHDFGVRIP